MLRTIFGRVTNTVQAVRRFTGSVMAAVCRPDRDFGFYCWIIVENTFQLSTVTVSLSSQGHAELLGEVGTVG